MHFYFCFSQNPAFLCNSWSQKSSNEIDCPAIKAKWLIQLAADWNIEQLQCPFKKNKYQKKKLFFD